MADAEFSLPNQLAENFRLSIDSRAVLKNPDTSNVAIGDLVVSIKTMLHTKLAIDQTGKMSFDDILGVSGKVTELITDEVYGNLIAIRVENSNGDQLVLGTAEFTKLPSWFKMSETGEIQATPDKEDQDIIFELLEGKFNDNNDIYERLVQDANTFRDSIKYRVSYLANYYHELTGSVLPRSILHPLLKGVFDGIDHGVELNEIGSAQNYRSGDFLVALKLDYEGQLVNSIRAYKVASVLEGKLVVRKCYIKDDNKIGYSDVTETISPDDLNMNNTDTFLAKVTDQTVIIEISQKLKKDSELLNEMAISHIASIKGAFFDLAGKVIESLKPAESN